MQHLQSFAVVANVNNIPRHITYDSLRGFNIEGLTASEAKMIVTVMESIDQRTLLALLQGNVGPTPQAPPEFVERQPETATTPKAPVEPPTAPPEDAKPNPAQGEEVAEAAVVATTVMVSASEEVSRDIERQVMGEMDEPAPSETPTLPPAEPPEPKAKPTPKTSRRAPPRPEELDQDSLPKKGDDFEGAKVLETKDHGDGGRMLILSDGFRVKLNAKGKEVARVEGVPPMVETPPSEELAESPVEKPPNGVLVLPAKIMESRLTRDVIEYLIENGVTEEDALVIECDRLRDEGAQAFVASRDEASVRRRVRSTLTVMGRA